MAHLPWIGFDDVGRRRLPKAIAQAPGLGIEAQADLVLCAGQRHGGLLVRHQQWGVLARRQAQAQGVERQGFVFLRERGLRVFRQQREHPGQFLAQATQHVEVRGARTRMALSDVCERFAFGQQARSCARAHPQAPGLRELRCQHDTHLAGRATAVRSSKKNSAASMANHPNGPRVGPDDAGQIHGVQAAQRAGVAWGGREPRHRLASPWRDSEPPAANASAATGLPEEQRAVEWLSASRMEGSAARWTTEEA